MKVMIIINPVAGKMRVKTTLFDIAKTFCEAGYDPLLQITTKKGDATKFAQKAIKEKYDLVVCCGGDGTLNETVTGIIKSEHKINLGYIPTGSTNDFAKTLGLSSIPNRAAKAIVEGTAQKVDIGSFGEDRWFTYIASFGIFTSASYTARQATKNVVGHLAYIVEGFRDIGVVKPYRVKVSTGEKTFEGDYIFGAVTNSTSVGGIVKLKKRLVDINDGFFEVVLVKNPKDVTELGRILVGIANSDLSDSMFEFFKCSEITFETEEEVSWSLDGEEASSGKSVTIKTINGAIEIIR